MLAYSCSKEMSDIEVLSSESSSERSEVVSTSEEEDGGDYFELNENFAPYKGEPFADSEDAVTMRVTGLQNSYPRVLASSEFGSNEYVF